MVGGVPWATWDHASAKTNHLGNAADHHHDSDHHPDHDHYQVGCQHSHFGWVMIMILTIIMIDQAGCQHSRFGWVTPTRCSTRSSMAFSIESSGDHHHDETRDNGR